MWGWPGKMFFGKKRGQNKSMIDLDKLSYEAYGNLVIVVLIAISLLFNLFPFDLFGLVVCFSQIPIYLYVRGSLKELYTQKD